MQKNNNNKNTEISWSKHGHLYTAPKAEYEPRIYKTFLYSRCSVLRVRACTRGKATKLSNAPEGTRVPLHTIKRAGGRPSVVI